MYQVKKLKKKGGSILFACESSHGCEITECMPGEKKENLMYENGTFRLFWGRDGHPVLQIWTVKDWHGLPQLHLARVSIPIEQLEDAIKQLKEIK